MVVEATQKERKNKKETRPINFDKHFWDCHWKQGEKSRGVGGGETPHMKVVGMLVVSLRGVNLGFWSHLGCSGQNAIIFSSEGLI